MKHKRQLDQERRRPLLEFNMVEEPKRLSVPRKGCLPFFGSVLLLTLLIVLLDLALH